MVLKPSSWVSMDSLGQFKSNVARFNTVLVMVDVQPSRVPTKVAVRSALYFIFSSTFILSVFLIYFYLPKLASTPLLVEQWLMIFLGNIYYLWRFASYNMKALI